MADLRCSNCSSYLFNGPVQCSCGDRLCGDCYNSFKPRKKLTCPKCAEEISLNDCFKDKPAENELKTATIKCSNQDCPWEGPRQFYVEHMASCKFKKTPCPNKQYGCPKLLLKSQWEEHLERECRFIPVQCPWCSKKVHNKELHIKQECSLVIMACPNGCGDKISKKDDENKPSAITVCMCTPPQSLEQAQEEVTSGPMLTTGYSDHTDLLEQSGNYSEDHQSRLSKCTMTCPIPMSDSMVGPGILGFGTIVEANIAAEMQTDSQIPLLEASDR